MSLPLCLSVAALFLIALYGIAPHLRFAYTGYAALVLIVAILSLVVFVYHRVFPSIVPEEIEDVVTRVEKEEEPV